MGYQYSIPVVAGADLSGQQYKAIAVGGTIAATNTLAMGLLQNKPKSGEDATLAYLGRSKFRAGGAVTAGGAVKVTTSGWIVAVASGDLAAGKALEAVSSGGIGEGVFGIATARSTPGA